MVVSRSRVQVAGGGGERDGADDLAAQVVGRPVELALRHGGEPHPVPAVELPVERRVLLQVPVQGLEGGRAAVAPRHQHRGADDFEVVVDDVDVVAHVERGEDRGHVGMGDAHDVAVGPLRRSNWGEAKLVIASSTSAVLSSTVARITRWPAARRAVTRVATTFSMPP